MIEQQRKERSEQERARLRLLTADPFDLEAQRMIAEEIRMENVNQNMETAMEHNPEAFAEVSRFLFMGRAIMFKRCNIIWHIVNVVLVGAIPLRE